MYVFRAHLSKIYSHIAQENLTVSINVPSNSFCLLLLCAGTFYTT
jgi:hypothetical protein